MEFARPVDLANGGIQPSFFDLLAQLNFDNILPALFSPIFGNSSLFWTGKAVVDLAMLAGFKGTLSEVVYGLERKRAVASARLRHNWIIYLSVLLESPLLTASIESIPLLKSIDFRLPLKNILKSLDILTKLAYITGDCKSFSLLHLLLGVSYKHSSVDVYGRSDAVARIVKAVLVLGQLAVFSIQSGILEKIKSATRIPSSSLPQLPPNPSTLLPKAHPNGYPRPKRPGLCPCCLEKWKDPVVVGSSGIVYCKGCLEGKRECPVTKILISDLIPIFLN